MEKGALDLTQAFQNPFYKCFATRWRKNAPQDHDLFWMLVSAEGRNIPMKSSLYFYDILILMNKLSLPKTLVYFYDIIICYEEISIAKTPNLTSVEAMKGLNHFPRPS